MQDPAFFFRERVVAVINGLQPGEVVSYGDVAVESGFPGAARAVGALLASDAADGLPWWRVVTASGRLVPGHEERHARLLRQEGIKVVNGRVRIVRTPPP
jgi:methylated-DNA-protein-cysteine methyltransferase-like protein